MKYATSAIALTSSLFALLQVALADSESFGIISARSGSPVHLQSVGPSNGVIVVGSSDSDLSAVVTDDGYLKYSNGMYVGVSSSGEYTAVSDVSKAVSGWSIADGSLELDGKTPFVAILSGSTYDLYNAGTGANDYGIDLLPFTKSGARASDFTASGSSSTSSSASSTTSTSTSAGVDVISQITDGQIQATTATVAPTSSVGDVISQITDGQVQATHTTATAPPHVYGNSTFITVTSTSHTKTLPSVSSAPAEETSTKSPITTISTQSENNGFKVKNAFGSVGVVALAGALLL